MAAVTCRFPRDSYTDSCTFAMSVCLSVCFSVCPCMLLCVYVYVRTCSCPSCCVPAWVRSTSAWRRGTGRCSWSDSAAHAWQQWAPEVHVEAVECCVCVGGGVLHAWRQWAPEVHAEAVEFECMCVGGGHQNGRQTCRAHYLDVSDWLCRGFWVEVLWG